LIDGIADVTCKYNQKQEEKKVVEEEKKAEKINTNDKKEETKEESFEMFTPLQKAKIPCMDAIAASGMNGMHDPV